MAIRVIRLLEYTYEDEETMAEDMGRWTHGLNANRMRMRSATLPPDAAQWEGPSDRAEF